MPPPPPPPSGGGVPGAVGALGLPPCRIEVGLRLVPARIDSVRLVRKNSPARIAVARVRTLAVPRLVMKPPVEPMPRPPPSERCKSTTPIMANTSIRWITMMTCCIYLKSAQIMPPLGSPPRRCSMGHIGIRGVSTRSSGDFPALPPLAVNRGNTEEIFGLEGGASDQGPLDLGHLQKLRGIGRLDRATIEDAGALTTRTKAFTQALAEKCGDLSHVGWCGRQSGSDCPHRLIGDHQLCRRGAIRERSRELAANHLDLLVSFALGTLLANPDDRCETRAPCGLNLRAYLRIGLVMVDTPLRVPHDHGGCAGVSQHLGGNIARMCAPRLKMAVLTADGDAGSLCRRGKACNQGGGRRNHQTYFSAVRGGPSDDLHELSARGGTPVHFPVARDQRNDVARH